MIKIKNGKVHMTLIDPATSGPEGSAFIAEQDRKNYGKRKNFPCKDSFRVVFVIPYGTREINNLFQLYLFSTGMWLKDRIFPRFR